MSSPSPQLNLILGHFARREAATKAKIVTLLAFGIPALFFGPLILSCIYWAIAIIWGFYMHWTWMFLASILILVPLLFWTEWSTGGSFYTDAVLSSLDRPQIYMTGLTDVDFLIQIVRNPRVDTAGLTELFLWGPRQILEAVVQIRRQRALATVNRSQAARILSELISVDHVNVQDLVHAGSETGTLAAMAYLLVFDWIGVSKDCQRAWIGSDSRTTLDK